MLGYMSVVYACAGDILIFDETFSLLEVLGIAILLTINVSLICEKCFKKEQKQIN